MFKQGTLLALVGTALFLAGPAHGHQGEQHGQPAAQTTSSPAPSKISAMAGEQATGNDDRPASEAGGSAAGSGDVNTAAGHGEAMVMSGQDAAEAGGGFVGVLKNVHPATVHFPIALFLMAAFTELIAMRRPSQGLRSAVQVMIYGGAAGAGVAALFGWIHTGLWFGGDATMQVHRWTGTGLAVAGALLAAITARASNSRTALRALLFTIAVAIVVQGFLGGELSNGPNHLGW